MKIWEILPQLQKGQKIKVTYRDVPEPAELVWDGSFLWYKDYESRVTVNKVVFEADFKLIPQFIPFEEALAELRKGKTICCEYDRKLPNETHWSGELIRITIAPDSLNQFISTDTMLHGKWWVK